MLDGISDIESLRGLARSRAKKFETKTINNKLVDDAILEGWRVEKQNEKTVRVVREKPHGECLEHRVWMLLYRMGFLNLSGEKGGILVLDPKNPDSPKTQIDVVGIDDEIALAIECKSSEKMSKRPQFQEELGKHALIREKFVNAINTQFKLDHKRQAVLSIFLNNIVLSENDKARAKEANIIIFDEKDLSYYESLVYHLGPAAKYQFLADMIPGKTVPGLEIRLPAIKTKMGGSSCYAFSISPEYLLKIAYVSHRSKGKASDVTTYQRMLSKARLNRIKQYISRDGIFPTNIVVNMENKSIRFERIKQETDKNDDIECGIAGWLFIKPAYKSAWIIDGQHRLYAYSGHAKAKKSVLSVLAFEGLAPSKQAELFIDINAKQKSVKQSLLQELYADLHKDAEDPAVRVRAIVSQAIQELDIDDDSALYERIQLSDSIKDNKRCISLTSVFGALDRSGFYISKEKAGHILEYGPLWAGENSVTLNRTVKILKSWFGIIKEKATDWWEKGSAEGGGLAMNDGVITCINVLRSVFQHLEANGRKLVTLDDDDFIDVIEPYAICLAEYFASLSEESRRRFRDLRGIQGQTTRTKRCQQAIHEKMAIFSPPGLEDFLKLEKAETNKKAKEIIDRIEITLQQFILEELKQEFKDEWWVYGVPKTVRLKVTARYEEEDGKRGGKENYFDLIDYRQIVLDHWNIFDKVMAFGKNGNKDKRTLWMSQINEKRKIVSHASSAVTLSVEELNMLEEYDEWLCNQINGCIDTENDTGEIDDTEQNA